MALGIENIKKLVKFTGDLTKQIAESTSDGWQWTDLLAFIDDAAAVPGIGKAWPDIKAEFDDLEPEERTELQEYFVQEFDIPNDKVEAFIENALMNAISLIALVEQFKALKTSNSINPENPNV
jgi:hypothetical protein